MRKVKMDQRKLMDNANTITDMAKVSIFCSIFFFHIVKPLFSLMRTHQFYNTLFVCVSIYMNRFQRQNLAEEWKKKLFHLLDYKRSYRLGWYSLNCVHILKKYHYTMTEKNNIIMIVEEELQKSYLLLCQHILPGVFFMKIFYYWIGEKR